MKTGLEPCNPVNGLLLTPLNWLIYCNLLYQMWWKIPRCFCLNSSTPSAAYKHQWTGSALVRVMTCRLFDAQLLPQPMLTYCQLDSWEQISVKIEFDLFYHLHSRKCVWKCRLRNGSHFHSGGDKLTGVQTLHRLCLNFWCKLEIGLRRSPPP